MKTINNFLYVIIVSSLLTGCLSSERNDDLLFYGYKLGDTLTSEFKVIKVQDFPFSRASLIKDKRIEVSLINNKITSISIDSLTSKEHSNYKNTITTKMDLPPVLYKGETPYNVKINGEVFYWHDTLKGIEVLLGRNPKDSIVFSHLTVYNQKLSDSLLNIYAPNTDTLEYEIIEF
jgi:hypothetical protein